MRSWQRYWNPAEDIVFALDAIQSPVSLYEPVYAESGDTLYILDQISDKKNKEKMGRGDIFKSSDRPFG